MAINPIPSLGLFNPAAAISGTEAKGVPPATPGNGAAKTGSDFAQFLAEAIQQVDQLQKVGEAASLGVATGQIQDLHTAVVAMEKAGLALSMTVEVRNKALDAYHEVMRMQI